MPEPLIIEHYKILRERLTIQGNRTWTRFNYFLAGEGLLVGITANRDAFTPLLPALGLAASVIWFVIGAGDIWYYRDADKRLESFCENIVLPKIPEWQHERTVFGWPEEWYRCLLCFRIPKIGVTFFASICPLLFFILWVILWRLNFHK